MGSLRVVPKDSHNVSSEEFQHYRVALKEARGAAMGGPVHWDVRKEENIHHVRKALMQVAEAEGIVVAIRKTRGSHGLLCSFKRKLRIVPRRISAKESRERILHALATAAQPMRKSDIIRLTGISVSTWNLRIRELLSSGKVERTGDRRESRYVLTA